ncbi:MAG: acyltransferase [Vicinamibacterales bacterium]
MTNASSTAGSATPPRPESGTGLKALARGAALVAVSPSLLTFPLRRRLLGADRAVEGTMQLLALVPGVTGQYLRRAFLSRTTAGCAPTAVVGFGTLCSKAGVRIDDHAYIGPGCFLGLAHIERDVLIGSAVHVTSGRHTHGTGDTATPIRDQEGRLSLVRIGAGAWIGSGSVVMADVGRDAVVGAGSVVTRPIPDAVIAAGVPAVVIRSRDS